jgi:hypothetical protein
MVIHVRLKHHQNPRRPKEHRRQEILNFNGLQPKSFLYYFHIVCSLLIANLLFFVLVLMMFALVFHLFFN